MEKNTWGGARENSGGKRKNAGRKSGSQDTYKRERKHKPEAELQKRRMIRLDDKLWEEFKKRGGAKWLREVLRSGQS